MNTTTEMLKGILEGSILEIISRGSTYGYAITQQLKNLGFEDIVEGTVYTVLVRLEKNQLVTTEKIASEVGPPRKLFTLTDRGYKELHIFWANWDFISTNINELRGK